MISEKDKKLCESIGRKLSPAKREECISMAERIRAVVLNGKKYDDRKPVFICEASKGGQPIYRIPEKKKEVA